MATEKQLLEQIYAAPHDDAPRLVYADHLTAKGDALGEFITLQVARAKKGKRTQGRERVLLASEGAKWWKDHPCRIGGNAIRHEYTARGFPSVFNIGWSVSDAMPQAKALAALTGDPGWATVTRLVLHYDVPGKKFVPLLEKSPLASLTDLGSLGSDALAEVGALQWPIEALELWNRNSSPLAPITGLPKLKRLTVDVRTDVEKAAQLVLKTGVVGRLDELELRGVTGNLEPALHAFAAMPPSLGALVANHYGGETIELKGDRRSPDAVINASATEVPELAELLTRLKKPALKSIDVVFAKGGFFTKKNTGPLRAQIDAALSKWR